MKDLIQTLATMSHLAPDEIVQKLNDFFFKPFDMRDMTSEIWLKHEDVYVHWYRFVQGEWQSDTSGAEGERLGNSYMESWADRPRTDSPVWFIISNVSYQENGPPVDPPR